MITDILIGVIAMVLAGIHYILSLITVAIPDDVGNAFGTIFSYAHVVDSVFPMTDALLAGSFVLSVFVTVYTVKVLLFGYSILPWMGKQGQLPKHGSDGMGRKTRS